MSSAEGSFLKQSQGYDGNSRIKTARRLAFALLECRGIGERRTEIRLEVNAPRRLMAGLALAEKRRGENHARVAKNRLRQQTVSHQ